MTPRTQALAYRIWAYCTPREWDCTYIEVAEALGVPEKRVIFTSHWRGWSGRFRSRTLDAERDAHYRGELTFKGTVHRDFDRADYSDVVRS